MGDTAIRVSGLGKLYQIGAARDKGDGLRHALEGGVRRLGQRLRGRSVSPRPATEQDFWALKDVSFEVKRGECVGVIGRNGAGKSTLLKVLSRITEPTTGEIALRGRVGSLLEVGTGFHPELTGRENIFLNGSVLGMSRREVQAKFDEIVAFSEVEKFLDTPVKRYSSGMYVRLAFAVAAHLEPEILIVDEVLAVGDIGFQRKCLGKMGDVTKAGRTILFVSHNMQAVAQLTTTVVQLHDGRVVFRGSTDEGVKLFTASQSGGAIGTAYEAASGDVRAHVAAVKVVASATGGEHVCRQPIQFDFMLRVQEPCSGLCFSFQVVDQSDRPVCYFWLLDQGDKFATPGMYSFSCHIPKFRLYMGSYNIKTWLSDRKSNEMIEVLSGLCRFDVTMRGIHRSQYDWVPGATVYLEDGVWSEIVRGE